MRNLLTVLVIVLGTVVLLVVGMRAVLRGRRVPTKAKLVLAGAVLWLLSPIDALPDVLPGVGVLDDLIVLVAAVRYLLEHLSKPEEQQLADRLPPRVRGSASEPVGGDPIEPSSWRLHDVDDRNGDRQAGASGLG